MKIGMNIGGEDSGKDNDFQPVVDYVLSAERLGADFITCGEAWGMDCITQLAYLAAKAPKLTLCAAVMQISARVPVMTAMTALAMATITKGRFILGLGTSGPQVVEGLHGIAFEKPLGRLREYVEIMRLAFSGKPIVYEGQHYRLPHPGTDSKTLKLAQPPNPSIPIFLATLAPKALELTGEAADGWAGTTFTPETASHYWGHFRTGAARSGRSLEGFQVKVPAPAGIGSDIEPFIARRKKRIAFQAGAMGSPRTNFYNNSYRRIGFADDAIAIQQLWSAGKRAEAAARVPDSMVFGTSLIGTEEMIKKRLHQYRDAGVTMINIDPLTDDPTESLDILGRIVELAREVSAAPSRSPQP